MIWNFAWRNVWRNKQRSMVVILAITLGLFGTIFILALSNGMVDQRIDAAINNEISHIQIHHPEFQQEKSTKYTISNAQDKLEKVSKIEGVKAVSRRLTTTAMASTASNGSGIVINGIDPIAEKEVSKIDASIIEGTYFETDSKTDPMIISKKLAEKLKAKLGSKIVITIQSMDGNLVYCLFRVRGIYKTANSMYDEMNVFVESSDLAGLIGFDESKSTEIAILLENNELTDQVTAAVEKMFPELDVMPWKELQPFLVALSSMMEQFSYMFLIIILIAMAFGIINTMLMAILERVKEIGMLMAMGMNKKRVFTMIMLETIFLSLTGGILGMIISYVTIELTAKKGINFASVAEGFEAVGYSAHVYPSMYASFYIILTILVIITGVLSSLYPAKKALKFKPAEAIRADT